MEQNRKIIQDKKPDSYFGQLLAPHLTRCVREQCSQVFVHSSDKEASVSFNISTKV